MINRLIQFSLEQRFLVLSLAGAVALIGLWSFSRLPIDAFPDTSPVVVQINTFAPALGAQDTEIMVSYPIEQTLGGLPGLREVRSLSKFGLSQVTALFDDETDIMRARQLVSERIATAELPPEGSGVNKPELGPIATGVGEVYHYLVTSDRHDLTELRSIHHWLIKSQLRTVPGVAEVNSWGGHVKQYHVLFDPEKLIKHHVTLAEVTAALRDNNSVVGGGNLPQAGSVKLVQGVGLATSLSDISNIVIKNVAPAEEPRRAGDLLTGSRPIRIRDIADVEIDHEIPSGAITAQGKGEVVLGLGFMLLGANSREVTERMIAKMVEIRKTLPAGVKVEEVYARTTLVDKVLATARDNLWHGALLVVGTLFVLGGGLRAGLIVAAAIPLSFLFAGNLMLQAGVAGSLMSLGAIDFGILVDSSVIMIENSVRRLSENHGQRAKFDVLREACAEVRAPTMFGELIIMIVYLPILTLQGIEGKLFRPMALTVLFALLGSLIVSLTVAPALAATFLPQKMTDRQPLLIRWALTVYRPMLRFVLNNRWNTVVVALAVLAVTGIAASEIKGEFIPKLREHSIVIATQRRADISLPESVRAGTEFEKLLLKEFPHEIDRIWTRTGTAEVATDPMGYDQGDVCITLKPLDQWTRARDQDDLTAQMREVAASVPGVQFLFTQIIEQRLNEMTAGIRADVGVKIYGDDLSQLVKLAEQVRNELEKTPGAAEVATDQLAMQPVLRIETNQEVLAQLGISRAEVLSTVAALGTPKVGEIREGQRRYPLVLRLAKKYREDSDAVDQLLTASGGELQLPLSRLATISTVEAPSVIQRDWAKRRLLVQCNVRGRALSGFVQEARTRIDKLAKSWPAGYHATFGGQFEHMQSARSRLAVVVPLSIFLIFVLLYASFNSARDALLIFSGIPFAIVGGVASLYFRGMLLSISAGVGFVALFGISTLNGLVLVSCIRRFVDEGKPLDEAIYDASLERLRPVLMTSTTAALGFLPMMLATAIGAEVQRPLASVVVGGVVSSLMLTLLVLPVLYSLFGKPKAHASNMSSD